MSTPRLKRIEVQGFKTFAGRVAFDLPGGIVAFVGPNGSGKSNLADAIRWGMGEQNPRLIRCRRSEEVMFGGGASLPPAGMAEVTLLFDNSDRWLDVDYEEVQIARRAYRSGENEYLLNNQKVRLKDIHGLFARAGLTENGSIVVGQGMIDSVLSLRPDRRRAFFEDAAGLAHCRTRLTEASVGLERTNDNLARVADLLTEIKPRLQPLSRRAGAALRYHGLADELHDMLGHLFASHLAKLSIGLQSNKVNFAKIEAEIVNRESEYRNMETRLQGLLSEETKADEQLADLRTGMSRKRETLVEAEKRLAILSERGSATREQLDSLARDRERTVNRTAVLSREREEVQVQLDSAANEVTELNGRLESLDRDLREISQSYLSLESRRRELSDQQTESDRDIIRLETRLAAVNSHLETLSQRRSRIKQQLAGCEQRSREIDSSQRSLAAQRDEMARTEAELSESINSIQASRDQALADSEDARKRRSVARDRFNELQSRMTALRQSNESGESLYLGVKNVLSAARNGQQPPRLSGIVGVVASLIEVPAELETALEVALGSHLQDIVVERWEDAEAAVGYLKQSSSGRATFLPLDTLRVANGRPPAGGAGVMGVASTLVRCDSRFAIVAEYLLAHTMVVSDMPVARQMVPKCTRGWQIVTVEGELVRSSGAVTGGAINRHAGGLLERERKARELPSLLASAETDLAQRESRLAEIEAARAKLDQELDLISRRHHEVSSRLATIEREHDRVLDSLKRADAERGEHVAELARNETGLLESEQFRQELASEIHAAHESSLQSVSRLSTLHSDVLAEKDRIEPLHASRDSCFVALTAAREGARLAGSRIDALTSLIAQEQKASADYAARLIQRRNFLAEVDGEIESTDILRRQVVEDLASFESTAAEAQANLTGIADTYRNMHGRVQSLGTELGRSREIRADLRSDVSATSVSIEGLLAQAANELDADVQQSPELETLIVARGDKRQVFERVAEEEEARLEQSAGALRRRLRSFGPIDASAPAEYESERQRVEDLEGETEQLQEAASKLGRGVRELELTMANRFEQAVAEINSAFARYFSLLFNGGVARIEIADDDEGSGLEIIARPPGKRTESLTALSGGERALAASALFFAILETSPSPFCVLDEVDAAFDDANIGRFCRILRDVSEKTQFLVITHNKHTMEAASALYGLAMVDKAVSKVVSVRLVEAAGEVQAKAS